MSLGITIILEKTTLEAIKLCKGKFYPLRIGSKTAVRSKILNQLVGAEDELTP